MIPMDQMDKSTIAVVEYRRKMARKRGLSDSIIAEIESGTTIDSRWPTADEVADEITCNWMMKRFVNVN